MPVASPLVASRLRFAVAAPGTAVFCREYSGTRLPPPSPGAIMHIKCSCGKRIGRYGWSSNGPCRAVKLCPVVSVVSLSGTACTSVMRVPPVVLYRGAADNVERAPLSWQPLSVTEAVSL